MNYSTIIGFIAAIVVFFATVFLSLQNAEVLLDGKSALMVLGGTFAVSVVCFSLKKILLLIKVFLRRMVGLNKINYMDVVDQIVKLSDAYKASVNEYEKTVSNTKHLFLKDAAEVLFWLESEVTAEKLRKLLENKADTFFSHYMTDAHTFRTLSKFPPAFGLMGTTLGMIALLQGLGEEGAAEQIGPAMAIALITTLYGLAVSNFILVPIAENLAKQAQEDLTMRLMIVEGIMLIQEGEPTKYVEESVKSYLLPSESQRTV
jgi:chemotaxis protein MotA